MAVEKEGLPERHQSILGSKKERWKEGKREKKGRKGRRGQERIGREKSPL